MAKRNAWSDVIKAVTMPLGFYVLSLLIVETFLGVVYVKGNNNIYIQAISLAIGTLLFLVIVGIVTFLVIKHPENLTFKASDHINSKASDHINRKKMASYGSKEKEQRKEEILHQPVIAGTGT